MHAERAMVPAARDALVAACPVVREGVPDSDAIAGVVPSFVAFPASTDEASALLRVAAAHQLSVVARGAGTGLGWAGSGWGAPPASADLVIDLQAMDQVLEHAAGDLVARVQAGVTMRHLASVLASAGQELAVDAPPDATAGGVVATGTAGPRRLRYGAPRDLLIGITVVRADGAVAHSGGKVVKNVAGYDLGKLFCGSAGTLGLITEVTFRLHPLPAAAAYVTAEFGPAGGDVAGAVAVAAGSALVPSAVQLDIPPQASPAQAGPAQAGPAQVGVLLEGTPSGVAERARRMAGLLSAAQMPDGQGSPAVTISGTPPAGWGRLPSAGTVVGVSFWVGALGDVLSALLAAGAQAGVRFAVTGPAGAGLVYACLDPDCGLDPAADHAAAAARFVTALRERLAPSDGPGRYGPRGSVTVLAAPEPVRVSAGAYGAVSAGAYGAVPGAGLMRAVKDQFDPDHRMFPGRFPWGQ
jgi:glycolate oxidase FAD binding subunit